MKRGSHDEQTLRERIAYIHGRLEYQIEAFADSLNVPRLELTQRLGAIFLGVGEGYADYLSDLQSGRYHLEAGSGSGTAPEVEGAVSSHGSLPQPERPQESVRPRQAAQDQVEHRGSAQKGYWAKMTPQQRRNEMRRRQAKWGKEAVKKWRGSQGKDVRKGKVKKAAPKAPVPQAA